MILYVRVCRFLDGLLLILPFLVSTLLSRFRCRSSPYHPRANYRRVCRRAASRLPPSHFQSQLLRLALARLSTSASTQTPSILRTRKRPLTTSRARRVLQVDHRTPVRVLISEYGVSCESNGAAFNLRSCPRLYLYNFTVIVGHDRLNSPRHILK